MHRGILYTAATGLVAGGFLGGQAFAQLPAQDFSYDYVEGGIAFTEFDRGGLDENPVGPQLIGSTLLSQDLFLLGEWSYLSDDADIFTLTLGPGYRLDITHAIDLYGVVSGAFRNIDPDGASSDNEIGYQLIAGIRHSCMFVENLAHTWEIRYLDIDTGKDFDDGIVNLRAKPVYTLSPHWDAVGELQIDDVSDGRNLGLALGARFNF